MIPENELGVLVLFAAQAWDNGFEILKVQASFPDLVIKKDGEEYLAEVEFLASNFKKHGHLLHENDIIICWVNDWPDCILPILELSNPDWAKTEIVLPTIMERELSYWKDKAQELEKEVKRLRSQKEISNDVERLMVKLGTGADILRCLDESPILSHAEIAEQLGITRQAVGAQIRKLIEEGLLEKNDVYGYNVLLEVPSGQS